MFSFKATKQIPKCLNRSLETPVLAGRRSGKALALSAQKNDQDGGKGWSPRWPRGHGGTRPCPAPPLLSQHCVPVAALSLLAGSLRPCKIPPGCPAELGKAGAGGAQGPRSAARPAAGQSGGRGGAHGEGVIFRGGQKHQHRWVDKKMEYCI